MRRWTASAKVSLRTRIGRVAAISAGTSTKLACSTRLADQGAPPTLRRISTYSIGLATRPSSMLASSHIDSLRRFSVLSANRIRPRRRLGRHRAGPQVGQAPLDGVGRLRGRPRRRPGSTGMNSGEPVEVVLGARQVRAALEHLQEVVVEVEDPHVPVGDQVELGAGGVGVGVGAQQGVVHGVELVLVPDDRP